MTADERKAQRARKRALANVDQFVAVADALKAGKLVTATKRLGSDILGARYTLSTLAKIAAGKALRRRFV